MTEQLSGQVVLSSILEGEDTTGTVATFSWNVATNSTDASIPAPVPGTVGGNIAPSNLTYFLAIDGLDGGSTDAKHGRNRLDRRFGRPRERHRNPIGAA